MGPLERSKTGLSKKAIIRLMAVMIGPVSRTRRPIRKESLRRIAGTFAPYVPQVVLTSFAVFAAAGLGLLSPFFLQIIVNRGLLGKNMFVIAAFSLYTLAATLGSTGLSIGYAYLSTVVGQRIMRDLRTQLYGHLQGMSLKFFTNTRTGEIQSRLVSDIGGIQSVVSDTAANMLSNVTIVVSTLVAMVYMDWRLTLLSVGILPVFAVIGAKVGDAARSIRTAVQTQLAAMNATMQETLSVSGVLLTKTSGRRRMALSHFQSENEALTKSQIRLAMVMRYFFNLIFLTFSITPVLVYWLAGYMIVVRGDHHLNLGTIVAFTALQSRLFFPLTNLMSSGVEIQSSLALFDRIFEYLDLGQDIIDAPDAITLDPKLVKGSVAIE